MKRYRLETGPFQPDCVKVLSKLSTILSHKQNFQSIVIIQVIIYVISPLRYLEKFKNTNVLRGRYRRESTDIHSFSKQR